VSLIASRPLRFVVALLGGWIAARAMVLWPSGGPIPVAAAVTPSGKVTPPPVFTGTTALVSINPAVAVVKQPDDVGRAISERPAFPSDAPGSFAPRTFDTAMVDRFPNADLLPPAGLVITKPPPPGSVRPSRLAGSAWTIVRPGGAATRFASQLGGSQAGMRLTYALGEARRLALSGRVSGALGSRQREAALGLDWKPTALPVHLIAEQRFGIEQARGGPSLGLIGGVGPTPIIGAVRIEAYGQAGAIARDGIEGFADGSVRLTRPIATLGAAKLDLGLGAWGGAQRGAARFDVGPAASGGVPVVGRNVRLSLEWRQRVAGTARPGSGPALSLGTDF